MSRDKQIDHYENGIVVPYEQIDSDTLRRMVQEFVTRDGIDWSDVGCTLEDKVEQVLQQLKTRKIEVVFDLTSETVNLISRY